MLYIKSHISYSNTLNIYCQKIRDILLNFLQNKIFLSYKCYLYQMQKLYQNEFKKIQFIFYCHIIIHNVIINYIYCILLLLIFFLKIQVFSIYQFNIYYAYKMDK